MPGAIAGKKLANQHQDHRFLIFKDADAWLAYDKELGGGNPFYTMIGHIDGMAQDIALLEILGPSPTHAMRVLKDTAKKAGVEGNPMQSIDALWETVSGAGNGVFHPVDYTLLNRKVDKLRLGHAYSVHGITGSLGWALAPAMLVPLTLAYSWRVALVAAAVLAYAVLVLLWLQREHLSLPASAPAPARGTAADAGSFDFLKLPAVWLCFAFFFFYAGALSIVQTFAPQAARDLHAVPPALVAICLTIYMVCSACGMVLGGFLASANPERSERIVGVAFGAAAAVALGVGFAAMPAWLVPVAFGAMGFFTGLSGPSRDMLVKRATPANATGRVYGVVYGGLDIGQALVPLGVGLLMDHAQHRAVWLALALLQGVLIVGAFRVGRRGTAAA